MTVKELKSALDELADADQPVLVRFEEGGIEYDVSVYITDDAVYIEPKGFEE